MSQSNFFVCQIQIYRYVVEVNFMGFHFSPFFCQTNKKYFFVKNGGNSDRAGRNPVALTVFEITLHESILRVFIETLK